MPRAPVEDNQRMNLRMRPDDKATLLRAAALRHTDLTDFVTSAALREAEAVIKAAEVVQVSKRDLNRIFELLENPPRPNEKLRKAIAALPPDL